MKNIRGFSLIELMIVIVIIAILAAVAIPSYRDSVRKSNRAEGKELVTRIAALQERYFFNNNAYGTLADLGFTVANPAVSSNGYYVVTLAAGPTCTTGGNTYPCFTLTATPQGSQADDTKCATLSITHTGNKTSTGGGDCW